MIFRKSGLNNTALVTGVAGFIGSHLADNLVLKGWKVIGIDCFTDYYSRAIKERNIQWLSKQSNFIFNEMDLSFDNIKSIIGLIESPITVFHFAAHPAVRSNLYKDFEMHIRNNIIVIQRLLEWGCNRKINKFIYASSSSVYGGFNDKPLKEGDLLKPISPYGLAKLTCENLCLHYWKNFGIPIVILRYFNVYGPRQRPDLVFYKFIRGLLTNCTIKIYGDGNQKRDFIYISDLVDGTILSLHAPDGEVFNIGSGKMIVLHETISIIEEILKKKAKLIICDKSRFDMQFTWADIRKAKNTFGFCPKYSLKKGISEQISWMNKLSHNT